MHSYSRHSRILGTLTDFVAAHDLSAAYLRLARTGLRLEEQTSGAPADLCAAQIRVAEAGAMCGLAKTTTYDPTFISRS